MNQEKAYLVSTPYRKVVYSSARDAISVFETTSGEYKVRLSYGKGVVPIIPGTARIVLAELTKHGDLMFLGSAFEVTQIDYFPGLGAI